MTVMLRELSGCYGALTETELLVVQAICAGHTSRTELAEALNVKPKTVAAHLVNIYSKVGVHNETALVLYALRAGWFDEWGQRSAIADAPLFASA